MSVKEGLALSKAKTVNGSGSAKRMRFDRCFSFMEISSIEPGSSLKDLDSGKLKSGIKKWAKAVVAYARQVSERF